MNTRYEIFQFVCPVETPPVIREELLEDYEADLQKKGWTIIGRTPKGSNTIIQCKKESL